MCVTVTLNLIFICSVGFVLPDMKPPVPLLQAYHCFTSNEEQLTRVVTVFDRVRFIWLLVIVVYLRYSSSNAG